MDIPDGYTSNSECGISSWPLSCPTLDGNIDGRSTLCSRALCCPGVWGCGGEPGQGMFCVNVPICVDGRDYLYGIDSLLGF